MFLEDYHLHTAVTVDGRMTEVEACQRALELGISEIAFTNHVMLAHPDYWMSKSALVEHWGRAQDCKGIFPDMIIGIGLEMDYYPDRENEIRSTMAEYEAIIGQPFDFVLGSVHEIRGCFFSNKLHAESFFTQQDLLSIYAEYFDLLTQAIRSHLFDVMAHPDLIKKYTYQLTPPVLFDAYKSSVKQVIAALIEENVGLEVNTKGLQLPIQETYPSMGFLDQYLTQAESAGVVPLITLGSDAHRVSEVGYGIAKMADMLYAMGVDSIARFESRKPALVKIG